jgi:segregation and condensation protein A
MPLKNSHEYEVKLDLFEGPLDLLLYLVTREEVNIVEISVSKVTTQYLSYLDLMRDLNIDIAADYLHMAATLTYLKARELLPQTGIEPPPDNEDGIYNREQLIRQLLEYQKFKQAAGALKNFEAEQLGIFKRGAAEKIADADTGAEGIDLGSLSVYDLLSAFKRVLEMARKEDAYRHVVNMDIIKIDDRIERILSALTDRDEVRFEDLFTDDLRKMVIVVTFMAILELVKMQEITFRQEECFGSIMVLKRQRPPELPAASQDAAAEAQPSPPSTTDEEPS